jgi:opacity protein-like surface antigen
MNRSLTAVIALTSLSCATLARADGIYISASVGYALLESTDATGANGVTTEIESKDGYVVRGALGYEFKPLRAEIEGTYGSNEVETVNTLESAVSGEVKVGAVMLNGYFDIPLSLLWLRPYVGAGLGYASADFDTVTGPGLVTIDDKDTVFAYQFIGGIAFELVKPIVAFGEYRYFATSSFNVTNSAGAGQEVDGLTSHSFNLGVRIHF